MIFVLSRVVPGDPGRLALGPRATQEAVDELNHQLYMDKPLPVQYACWIRDIFKGDLGISIVTKRSVSQDVAQFLPATLEFGSGGWCVYGVRCVAVGNAGGAIQGLICRRPSPRHVLYGDRAAIHSLSRFCLCCCSVMYGQ